MIWRAQLVLLTALAIAGCQTAHDVAVSSFRVVDAPAQYIRNHIDQPQTTAATTTGQNPDSDVRNPGGPVNPPASAPTPVRHTASQNRETEGQKKSAPVPSTETATTSRRNAPPSATPRPVTTQTVQFPTARPVPGKPGYVYSIDPKGGIVDVTGYKTGDRAKDPYTQQVFIVP